MSFAYEGGQRATRGGGSNDRGPAPDWTPAERAEHARNVAGNLRRCQEEVRQACATMADASTPDVYSAAATRATAAVASLRDIAARAPSLVDAAVDPEVVGALAAAAQSVIAAEAQLAGSPVPPAAQVATSSGIAAVIATLPPLAGERRQESPAVVEPIFAALRGQLEFPDIKPLRAALDGDGEVGERFRLLSVRIRDQICQLLADNQFVQRRRFEHEDRLKAQRGRGVDDGFATRTDDATTAEPDHAQAMTPPADAAPAMTPAADQEAQLDAADDEGEPLKTALTGEAGTPFPDAASYQDEVGADLSGARVVTGPRAEAAAAAVDARAFTVGDRVFMGAGEDPRDRDLAAHELTHVAQQQGAEAAAELTSLPVTEPGDAREQEAERSSEQVSPGPLEIARTPRGVRSQAMRGMQDRVIRLAAKSDEELVALRAELTARLAGSLDAKQRKDASHERDAIEWIEYTRRLERGERGPASPFAFTSDLSAAQVAGAEQGVDATQIGARAQLEAFYRRDGVGGTLATTMKAVGGGTAAEQRAAYGQSAAIEQENEAFRTEFREQARYTAMGMLDQSTEQIDAALRQYGFAGGSHRLFFAADAYNRDPDQLPQLVADWRTLSDTDDRKEPSAKGDKQQLALAKVVTDLRARQAKIEAAEAEEKNFREEDWARLDATESYHSSMAMRAELAEAWLAAEDAHPMLLAFRDPKYGAVVGKLDGLTAPGAGMEEAILRQAIPKLGNILRTRVALRTGKLSPLRMGPVVETTKQAMGVPPDSLRAAVVRQLYQEANAQSITDEVLSAVNIALMVASFIPGPGPVARVLAEATSLAIELRAQVNEYNEWKVAGGMNNTALDMARSVSLQAPEMRPLYLRLAVAGASVANIAQLARLSSKLRTLRAAESATDDVVRELDALGEQFGVKHLADDVETAGAVKGAKTYPAKTFEKEGVTRVTKINAEKVRQGLKATRGRTFVGGARLEIDAAAATAEGGAGVLRVPGAHGDMVVDVEIRFRGELSAPGPHGADSGPARFTLDHSGGGWKAKVEVSSGIDPVDVDFVVGHELDEIAELTRRFPSGKPTGGFGAEVEAGVMRPGAKTAQSTAHDVASAREIVALDADHRRLAQLGAASAEARGRSLDEAMKAAGLDDLAELDAKLRLLKQEGAPEALLDRVRRTGSKAVAADHAAAMGAKGTRFTEDMIDHVMWGRGRGTSEFKAKGVSGGHFTHELLDGAFPNSEYVFVEDAAKAAGGSTARRFKQYKWDGGRASMPQPGSGRFPTDKPFNDAGWALSEMPKTSFDDAQAFLREAEEAWGHWLDGMALAPPGRSLKFNEFTARTQSGVQISGFFDNLPSGETVPTTFFVEASWF